MAVEFFLGKGFLNEERQLKWARESEGVLKICQAMYDQLQQSSLTYAVVVNPGIVGNGRELTPDVIIISPLGLGVIEEKSWEGEVNWGHANDPEQPWRHGSSPYLQVKEYTSVIYKDLTFPSNPDKRWLPMLTPKDKEFFAQGRQWIKIFATACFTHKDVNLERVLGMSTDRFEPSWFSFSVSQPSDIPNWAFLLRFEHDWSEADKTIKINGRYIDLRVDQANDYQPLMLQPAEIKNLAINYFHAVEWLDMYSYVSQGAVPYAYLKIMGDDTVPLIRIDREEIRLGRSPEFANGVIPRKYLRVSRNHAKILCLNGQIFIEDLDSKHGTYLQDEEEKLKTRSPLPFYTRFLLGGSIPSEGVCELELIPPDKQKTNTITIDTKTN